MWMAKNLEYRLIFTVEFRIFIWYNDVNQPFNLY